MADFKLFEELDCPDCGVRFGVPAGYTNRRRQDKKSFYCPNGHSMSYKESPEDIIRRERDRLKQALAEKDDVIARQRQLADTAGRAAAAARGLVTKMRNRAAAGVCPCCNRTVSQLARHMASKHPGFKTEEVG